MANSRPLRARRLVRAAVAIAVMLGGFVAVQATTSGTAFAGCISEYFYDITGYSSTHLPAAGSSFKDGPGGSMTVSVTQASTITTTATVSAGATVSGIIAQAKVEVSASIQTSTSITVGHTYTHAISAGKYGHLVYGSWGYSLSWAYQRLTAACTITRIASGTAKAPTNEVGWRYWETTT